MPILILVSDTHGHHSQVVVPQGDILIHCGDCTDDIGQAALRSFLQWFEGQSAPRKILVAGNHCGAFEKWPDLAQAMVKEVAPSVTYLQDSGVEIAGLKFWGSPVTPTFYNWHFNRDRGAEIKRYWDMIPDDIDILVTHGPARGYLDWSPYGKEHVGCDDLLEAIKRVKPKVHACGHVHGGYGTKVLDHEDKTCTVLINASICNEQYAPVNKPWVVNV